VREVTSPAKNINRKDRDHAEPQAALPARRYVSTDQESIGNAQVALRNTNETIQASADRLTLVLNIPFICECPDPNCSEIVNLSFETYDAIRQSPRQFFNISGHEVPSVKACAERVIAVMGELTIVEKIGVAGDVATAGYERLA
jgi:hypothetical protein